MERWLHEDEEECIECIVGGTLLTLAGLVIFLFNRSSVESQAQGAVWLFILGRVCGLPLAVRGGLRLSYLRRNCLGGRAQIHKNEELLGCPRNREWRASKNSSQSRQHGTSLLAHG